MGLKADRAHHLLFVAGDATGADYVYETGSGTPVATYQFASSGAALLNDVIVTGDGAYFTDSFSPVLYKIPIGPGGAPDLTSGAITSVITDPLFRVPTTVAKHGDRLALVNGRFDLGLPPPFGPGAPPGTDFGVAVVRAT